MLECSGKVGMPESMDMFPLGIVALCAWASIILYQLYHAWFPHLELQRRLARTPCGRGVFGTPSPDKDHRRLRRRRSAVVGALMEAGGGLSFVQMGFVDKLRRYESHRARRTLSVSTVSEASQHRHRRDHWMDAVETVL